MKFLKIFESIYHFFSGTRNLLYDADLASSVKIGVPVISVGNLSFGGVGKTPCIIFLAGELALDFKTVIVCKSYKAELKRPQRVDLINPRASQLFGDEACVIQQQLPNCTVWSGPQKFETAKASLVDSPKIVLVDDAFSHRKLHRNFDLVLIDATVGFDTYLRESQRNLKRASAVLITKVNMTHQVSIEEIEKKILKMCPHLKGSIFHSGVKTSLNLGNSQKVMIFCGLARPQSFIQDVKEQKVEILHQEIFTDHHQYTVLEQKKILAKFLDLRNSNRDLRLLTTHKDSVKITDVELKKHITVADHTMVMDEVSKEALLEKIRKSF